jgi:hypothetical protein
MKIERLIIISLTTLLATGCCAPKRCVRTAEDITPGNIPCTKLDWRYGAGDIRIQTSKITGNLMDRWAYKTGYNFSNGKPRIIITDIDNNTDNYISSEMIRDIFEGAAADDGRFTIVVGNKSNEKELDRVMDKVVNDPKYANSSRLQPGRATAPQFLAKVRITKAVTSDPYYDYEDYRMQVTLYDIETQEVIDSDWDVLSKKVQGRAR